MCRRNEYNPGRFTKRTRRACAKIALLLALFETYKKVHADTPPLVILSVTPTRLAVHSTSVFRLQAFRFLLEGTPRAGAATNVTAVAVGEFEWETSKLTLSLL